jgi:hypothetical protein
MTINSVESMTINSVESMTINSVESMTINSVESMTISSVESMTINSVESMTINSVESMTINSVESMTINSVESMTCKLPPPQKKSPLLYGELVITLQRTVTANILSSFTYNPPFCILQPMPANALHPLQSSLVSSR